MGIEPTTTAWKAVVLPLNYTRKFLSVFVDEKHLLCCKMSFQRTNFYIIQSFQWCVKGFIIFLSILCPKNIRHFSKLAYKKRITQKKLSM